MTTSRLKALSPRLDELMRRVNLDPSRQHRAAIAASRIALQQAGVQECAAATVLTLLDDNKTPDRALMAELEATRDRMDKQYLELHESGDESNTREAIKLFSQARAMASICYAAEAEREHWSDAVYEAAMAIDDPSEVIEASLKIVS